MQDDSAEHHITSQRTKHILTGQRRRLGRLPEVAGLEREGKRLRKYYQVVSVEYPCTLISCAGCHRPRCIDRSGHVLNRLQLILNN